MKVSSSMTNTLPEDHADLPKDGNRPHLPARLDSLGILMEAMAPNVIYALSDRPCSSCVSGQREEPGRTVALVKRAVDNPNQPWRIHTLCEEHAAKLEKQEA